MTSYTIYSVILYIIPLTLTSNQNAITKDVGKISFFEKTWTHTFDLSLQSYIENAILLQNVTDQLIHICEHIPNDIKCKYFRENVEKSANAAKKDVDLLLHHRVKRSWAAVFSFGREIVKQALFAVGIIGITEYVHGNQMEKIEKELEMQKKTIISMYELNNLRNNLSTITNSGVNELFERVNNMNVSSHNKGNVDDLLDLAKDALSEHYQETTKFTRILNNDLRKYFFIIIDMDTFLTQIKQIDLLLHPNAKLPTLNPYNLLDLSTLSYTNNMTHVSIHIKMPITSHIAYNLHEFVPIPIKEDNKLKILRMNSKLYFEDNLNVTKVMQSHISQQCSQMENHMYCDSLLHESLDLLNECMSAILYDKSTEKCTYKRIEYRNYFIRLTPHIVFCFIVNPIQFRVVCNNQEKIYNLNTSVEIDFSEQCDLHKILNELDYDSKTYSEMEINKPLQKPDFSIFDTIKNNWTNDIDFFNESNITLTKILETTNEINATIHQESSESFLITILHIPGKIFFHLKNIISNILTYTILYICTCLVVLFLIVFLCHKCFKRTFSLQV